MRFAICALLLLQSAATVHSLPVLLHMIADSAGAGAGSLATALELAGNGVVFRAVFSAILVLLGGVFAGLTIGLIGQDEIYLQVLVDSGEPHERAAADKVLQLISKGKHWVLVTLLLSNVITNETLPIVLDRLLGGGWPAIVSSTAAIVLFGEIIPQSICVRYGLSLGAYFAPFVQFLMYALYPVAYPIALLLDICLGKNHGTVYKKKGLKSLVLLHQQIGVERLNKDEVTIISAVLDLRAKSVSSIMTPIADVFVLSSDTILDEAMVQKILLTGFNRIPIHVPGEPQNFVGMLLVRTLITYDPEDCLPISSFALATLPETYPDTSCLNILNYFQEGKSHMVAVSTRPGAAYGAIGVLTLEDVIEELIGEEIVDESDVYVNVHKAIRRPFPAPMLKHQQMARLPSGTAVPRLRPSNRARNPKTTSNAKIAIKRDPYNSPGQSLLPQTSPHKISTSLDGHAHTDVHADEYADAHRRSGPSASPDGKSYVLIRHKDHSDLIDLNDEHLSKKLLADARAGDDNGTSAKQDEQVIGTFIENVVRVGGVNKVIIEAAGSAPNDAGSRRNSPDSGN